MITPAISSNDLQTLYADKRRMAVKTILQVCTVDNVDKDVFLAALYALIHFHNAEYVTELLGLLIKAQKTELLYLTVQYMEVSKISPTIFIDYVRPLGEDGRRQIITLLGMYTKDKRYNSAIDATMEWFYYNDSSLENRNLAGKYIVLSKREETLVYGVPLLGYILAGGAAIFVAASSSVGLKGIAERLGVIGVILLCLSPILYIPAVLLLQWSRSKPFIRFLLIGAFVLSIIYLYFEVF